jgi:phosphoglycolate phosphatase-like HAD superfamily hydrolase
MKSSRRQALGAIAGLYGAALPQRVNAGGLQLPIRLAVLDVGGTIVEERGDIPEALAGAFEKRGITVSSAEINQWRGAAKRDVVRHFVTQHTKVPDAERDKLIEAVYTDFSARIVDSYKTVKGIPGAAPLPPHSPRPLAVATAAAKQAAVSRQVAMALN